MYRSLLNDLTHCNIDLESSLYTETTNKEVVEYTATKNARNVWVVLRHVLKLYFPSIREIFKSFCIYRYLVPKIIHTSFIVNKHVSLKHWEVLISYYQIRLIILKMARALVAK